jgi:hypothetical protein
MGGLPVEADTDFSLVPACISRQTGSNHYIPQCGVTLSSPSLDKDK